MGEDGCCYVKNNCIISSFSSLNIHFTTSVKLLKKSSPKMVFLRKKNETYLMPFH